MATSEDQTVSCPSCSTRTPLRAFAQDGFLRGRPTRSGGPYYELACVGCAGMLVLETATDGTRIVSRKTRGMNGLGTRRDPAAVQFFGPDTEAVHAVPEEGPIPPTAGVDHGVDGAATDETDPAARDAEDSKSKDEGGEGRGPIDGPGELSRFREIVGVGADATEDEVRSAFRERSKRFHPDRFVGLDDDFQALAHEKFIELKQATDALLAIMVRHPKERECGETR